MNKSVNTGIRRFLIQRTFSTRPFVAVGQLRKQGEGDSNVSKPDCVFFPLLFSWSRFRPKGITFLEMLEKDSWDFKDNHSRYTGEWEEGKAERHHLLGSHLASLGFLMAVG